MAISFRILCLSALATTLSMAQPGRDARFQLGTAPDVQKANRLAPDVRSPMSLVDRMLNAAALKPGETLYDLGCGDGRILIAAAQKYRVKAIGVELLPSLAKDARDNIQKNNLQEVASVIQDDARNVDLRSADVVTLYLTTEFNEELRPNLEKFLRPGTRVVSLDYPIPGWKVKRKEMADLYNRKHPIYIYTMPPQK